MYLSFAESRCLSQTSNQLGSQEGQQAFWEKLVKGSNLVNFLKKKRAVEIGPTCQSVCVYICVASLGLADLLWLHLWNLWTIMLF